MEGGNKKVVIGTEGKEEVGLAVMKATLGERQLLAIGWSQWRRFLIIVTRIRDLSVQEIREDGELLLRESYYEKPDRKEY